MNVVVGAGGTGVVTAELLAEEGHDVRLSRNRPQFPGHDRLRFDVIRGLSGRSMAPRATANPAPSAVVDSPSVYYWRGLRALRLMPTPTHSESRESSLSARPACRDPELCGRNHPSRRGRGYCLCIFC